MDINIKLKTFEGPFDLLYHLIEKNQIDIYDIPISELTDQYLEYIAKMDTVDLDLMSEFLLMASTLIEIKSKMLLPQTKNKDIVEEDPRDELVNKLIEYKKFKLVAEQFASIQENEFKIFFKNPNTNLIQLDSTEYSVEDSLKSVTLVDILIAFENVIKRKEKKLDKVRSKFNSVQKDLYTIEDKSEYILNLLELTSELKFNEIFRQDADKIEIVVTFLALLELIKLNKIFIYQKDLFDDIILKK